MKYKIAIVGAGNAGCITALHFYKHLRDSGDLEKFEITMYHSPDNHPIEKVGQGTTLTIPQLIADTLNMNWHNNPIGATFKSGILYEGWGKKQTWIRITPSYILTLLRKAPFFPCSSNTIM